MTRPPSIDPALYPAIREAHAAGSTIAELATRYRASERKVWHVVTGKGSMTKDVPRRATAEEIWSELLAGRRFE